MKETPKKPENPQAFPVVIPGDEKKGWDAEHLEGMSLRDYFAAKAMQGEIINPDGYSYSTDLSIESGCKLAYKIADGMLKAREAIN